MATLELSTATNSPQPFRFRDLPLELQIRVLQVYRQSRRIEGHVNSTMSLILLDRAAYHNLALYFYRDAAFTFYPADSAIGSFAKVATDLCLHNVRHMRFKWFAYKAFYAHAWFPGVGKTHSKLFDAIETLINRVWLLPNLSGLVDLELRFRFPKPPMLSTRFILFYGLPRRLFGEEDGGGMWIWMDKCLNGVPSPLQDRLQKTLPQFNIKHHGLMTYGFEDGDIKVAAKDGVMLPKGAKRMTLHEAVLTLSKKTSPSAPHLWSTLDSSTLAFDVSRLRSPGNLLAAPSLTLPRSFPILWTSLYHRQLLSTLLLNFGQ